MQRKEKKTHGLGQQYSDHQRQKGEGGREEDRGGINGDRRHDLGW